jgi:alpha-tubulin suppressor-like RCC1 family protein
VLGPDGEASFDAVLSPEQLGDIAGVITLTTSDRVCTPLPTISFVGVGVEATGARLVGGDGHSCTLSLGRVFCWGNNLEGQLGDGGEASSPLPRPVAPLTSAVGLAAGLLHTCALDQGGTVSCWGANGAGQTGTLAAEPRLRAPRPVFGLRDARALAAGAHHTCAVDGTQGVVCWGLNDAGQLGDPRGPAVAHAPRLVAGVSGARNVAAGARHTCAPLTSGKVLCWGDNSRGQLGAATPTESSAPVEVAGLPDPTLDPVTAVVAGAYHTCALTGGGRVMCWGENSAGQCGAPPAPRVATPVAVPGLGKTAVLRAGRLHTCAVGEDRFARCWGSNSADQLGGDTRPATSSTPLRVGANLGDVVDLGAGSLHTCAVRQQAQLSVLCWGHNGEGQLGNGGTANQPLPALVRFQ